MYPANTLQAEWGVFIQRNGTMEWNGGMELVFKYILRIEFC